MVHTADTRLRIPQTARNARSKNGGNNLIALRANGPFALCDMDPILFQIARLPELSNELGAGRLKLSLRAVPIFYTPSCF